MVLWGLPPHPVGLSSAKNWNGHLTASTHFNPAEDKTVNELISTCWSREDMECMPCVLLNICLSTLLTWQDILQCKLSCEMEEGQFATLARKCLDFSSMQRRLYSHCMTQHTWEENRTDFSVRTKHTAGEQL